MKSVPAKYAGRSVAWLEAWFEKGHRSSECRSEQPGPGDYEIKILLKGRLSRSLKFAVDAEGKLVNNGIAAGNKLGSDRLVVPVQVIGDADGPWNRNSWKTDAFYGNPLTGFTAP